MFGGGLVVLAGAHRVASVGKPSAPDSPVQLFISQRENYLGARDGVQKQLRELLASVPTGEGELNVL